MDRQHDLGLGQSPERERIPGHHTIGIRHPGIELSPLHPGHCPEAPGSTLHQRVHRHLLIRQESPQRAVRQQPV